MGIIANIDGIGVKNIKSIFANIGGEKKEIISAWANKDGVATKVFGKNAGGAIYVFARHNTYSGENPFCYSYDLKTFNYCNIADTGNAYNITFVNDRFFAQTTNGLYYSFDGINFEQCTLNKSASGALVMFYENGTYYGIGAHSYTSTDGINFTYTTTNYSLGAYYRVTKFKGRYFLASSTGNKQNVYVSDDLSTWSELTAGSYSVMCSYDSCAVSDDRIIFYQGNNSRIYAYYSDDGITFKRQSVDTYKYAYSAIYANNAYWIALRSSSSDCLYKTSDGISNLEQITASLSNVAPIFLEFNQNKFIGINYTKFNQVYTSNDFINWQYVELPYSCCCFAYSNIGN